MVVGVVGFPRSGKSTFIYQHLYPFLIKRKIRFFVQAANPDGEGVWTYESPLGKALRVKQPFDSFFLQFVLNSIKNLSTTFPLVIVDCGGKISAENRQILSLCDCVIIVYNDERDLKEWLSFLESIKRYAIFPVRSSWDGEKVTYDKTPDDLIRFLSSHM